MSKITLPRWLSPRKVEAFQALYNRNYRLLWIGQLGGSAAQWVEVVARGWLIWQLTGSATLLAVVSLLRALPMLTFGLFAGVAADRFDNRKILIICKVVTLINYIVIATLITTNLVEVWHVLLSSFVMGCSHSFEQPTRNALVPSLVSKDELTNAVALNSGAMNATRVVGPGVAGVLVAPIGVGGVYYLSAVIYVITLVATIMMRVPPMTGRSGNTSMWSDMDETFRYVYREKAALALVLISLVPVVFGMPYMTLMPIFADRVLNIGPAGLGWLYMAGGIGAMVVILTIATLGRVPHKGLLSIIATVGFGAFLVAFSQSTRVPLSLFTMALVGFASTAPRILTNTSLLEITPPGMRGRMMAIYTLDRGLMPLGTMLVGPLADVVGAPTTLMGMGGVCILVALAVGLALPIIRRIE
ncbi:MAG: MFS transporter [Chloroflexota bacterium]